MDIPTKIPFQLGTNERGVQKGSFSEGYTLGRLSLKKTASSSSSLQIILLIAGSSARFFISAFTTDIIPEEIVLLDRLS